MNRKLVAYYFLGQIAILATTGVAMFWSSGQIDWWAAWAALGVWVVWFAVVDIVIFRVNTGLLAERLSPPKDAKDWDRAILSILRLIELARYILAGLDQRYEWTKGFPLTAQLIALAVCFMSTAVFAWSMAANPFFSQVVRIQSDRGHTVVTGGPYRYVRHPSYISTVLFELAISTLLASWWAILLSVVCVVIFIIRTRLEDRTLQVELDGYAEYSRQVRYRLVPGIW